MQKFRTQTIDIAKKILRMTFWKIAKTKQTTLNTQKPNFLTILKSHIRRLAMKSLQSKDKLSPLY